MIIFLVLRSDIGEEVLVDCLKYMDSLLDKVSDHSLLDQLYSKNRELCQVIVFSANKRLSLGYVNRTLKLAVRFLQLGKCNFVEFNIMVIVNLRTTFTKCANVIYFFTAEKPVNSSMRSLCSSLSELCHIDHANIEAWLRRIILGVEEDKGNTGKMADNRLLLQTFATHIVKESRYNTLRGLVM